jgi:hypothetical protein
MNSIVIAPLISQKSGNYVVKFSVSDSVNIVGPYDIPFEVIDSPPFFNETIPISFDIHVHELLMY